MLLDLDGGVRRIDFWEEEEDEKENQAPDKEMRELGNTMYMGHFEPCPPDWYTFNSRFERSFKEVIKDFLS